MPSPACQIREGAGAYAPATNGFNATPAATITINLIDSSANSWDISCVTTDELSDAATVTASLTIDPVARTATFVAPDPGRAYRFRSRVNNGIGPDKKRKSSYTTYFIVYTLASGERVVAADETTEGNSTFGWLPAMNRAIRGNGAIYLAADFTTTLATAQDTLLAFKVKSGETWEFTFEGSVQCNNTGGVKFAISAPGGSTVEGWLDSCTSAITTKSYQRITGTGLTGTAVHTQANTPAPDKIRVVVTAGADGTVRLQVASNTATQTTTIFARSTFKAKRLAAAA